VCYSETSVCPRVLCPRGLNLEVTRRGPGRTALDLAVDSQKPSIVELLHDLGGRSGGGAMATRHLVGALGGHEAEGRDYGAAGWRGTSRGPLRQPAAGPDAGAGGGSSSSGYGAGGRQREWPTYRSSRSYGAGGRQHVPREMPSAASRGVGWGIGQREPHGASDPWPPAPPP